MAVAIKQYQTATNTIASPTITFPQNITAGNYITLICWANIGSVPTSITDSLTQSWIVAGTTTLNYTMTEYTFAATASGACTVTVNMAGAANSSLFVCEYSDASATSQFTNSSTASNTTLSTGSYNIPAYNLGLVYAGCSPTADDVFNMPADTNLIATASVSGREILKVSTYTPQKMLQSRNPTVTTTAAEEMFMEFLNFTEKYRPNEMMKACRGIRPYPFSPGLAR